jgi:hypothetical protein
MNREEMSKLPAIPLRGERLSNEQMQYAYNLKLKGEVSPLTWTAWVSKL